MRISGFSFVRDGLSLDYPVVESIRSILPLCDEFVVAVGKGSPEDRTRDAIAGIGDPKIRILDTEWDEGHFRRGAINAIQTDLAREACTGDWLFYVQADEVVHEKYLDAIGRRCEELVRDREVEGLLFRFRHFWGDYDRYAEGHAWYAREIRIVRNDPAIRSWHSAQSFRYYERYEHPWQESHTRKLRVARVDAEIFHYGWVRPPHLMQRKNKALNVLHAGRQSAEARYAALPSAFDYGHLDRLPRFSGTHPAVMRDRIAAKMWRPTPAPPGGRREVPKHERLRYRLLTAIEKVVSGGEPLFANRNYVLLRR